MLVDEDALIRTYSVFFGGGEHDRPGIRGFALLPTTTVRSLQDFAALSFNFDNVTASIDRSFMESSRLRVHSIINVILRLRCL